MQVPIGVPLVTMTVPCTFNFANLIYVQKIKCIQKFCFTIISLCCRHWNMS